MEKMENKIFNIIGSEQYDMLADVSFKLASANAKVVSDYLKGKLTEDGINVNEYNSTFDKINEYHTKELENIENPQPEIYTYQPFVLLEKLDGSYSLLDGFRRLLWYNTPNILIITRIYKESDLTDNKLFQLLLSLNQFKFFGGFGDYYDRGFSLGMKTLFNVDILKFNKAFDGYLSYDYTKKSYYDSTLKSTEKFKRIQNRMSNPMFLTDIKFIESLCDNDIMVNKEFGSLIYKYRQHNPDKIFNTEFFIKKAKENDIHKDLYQKYLKYGDGNGSKQIDVINGIVECYKNIIREMFGGVVEKTYLEKVEEVKELVNKFKKNKNYSKLTNNRTYYLYDSILENRILNKKPIKFKCFVYPHEQNESHFIKYGELKYEIKPIKKESKFMHEYYVYGFETEDGVFIIEHNYEGNKYTKINKFNHNLLKIELFVDITKEEVKEFDKKGRNIR